MQLYETILLAISIPVYIVAACMYIHAVVNRDMEATWYGFVLFMPIIIAYAVLGFILIPILWIWRKLYLFLRWQFFIARLKYNPLTRAIKRELRRMPKKNVPPPQRMCACERIGCANNWGGVCCAANGVCQYIMFMGKEQDDDIHSVS